MITIDSQLSLFLKEESFLEHWMLQMVLDEEYRSSTYAISTYARMKERLEKVKEEIRKLEKGCL